MISLCFKVSPLNSVHPCKLRFFKFSQRKSISLSLVQHDKSKSVMLMQSLKSMLVSLVQLDKSKSTIALQPLKLISVNSVHPCKFKFFKFSQDDSP